MQRRLKRFASRTIGAVAALSIPLALASDGMPIAQQNALVQRYCAVCHTDAARNGGLSLEHFDAADAAPSLKAMMISKLTSGASLETVRAAASEPNAAAVVARKMKSGAMGAAGLPIPDKETIDALINALASDTTGAREWKLNRTQDPATKEPVLTASVLREKASPGSAGDAAMYRLVVACNATTQQGEMQLSWAPAPKTGTLSAVVDGKTSFAYKVEGAEKMGNGSQGTTGPAAINLYESNNGSRDPKMPLPTRKLTISDLFPDETVEFSFDDLNQTTRRQLAACFIAE